VPQAVLGGDDVARTLDQPEQGLLQHMPVLGVHELQHPLAHLLLGVAPEDPLVRGALVADHPLRIQDADHVRGVLDQGSEALLAGAQRLLGPAAVGDVLQRPLVAQDLAAFVADGPHREAHPDQRAVVAAHRRLEGLDRFRGRDGLLPAAAVLRVEVDVGEVGLQQGLDARIAEDADDGGVGVQHLPGGGRAVEARRHPLEKAVIALLRLPQRRLGPLARGDVAGEGAVVAAALVLDVVEGDLGRKALAPLAHVLGLEGERPVRARLFQDLHDRRVHLGAEDVQHPQRQHLLPGVPHHGAARLVGVEEPPFRVDSEGALARAVQQELRKPEGLLRFHGAPLDGIILEQKCTH
jgi:hypothetical protein